MKKLPILILVLTFIAGYETVQSHDLHPISIVKKTKQRAVIKLVKQ